MRMIEFEVWFIRSRKNLVNHGLTDDSRQKIMHNHPLVMPADLLLYFCERSIRHKVNHPVVKPDEHTLQLRYDHIFIVAWIADDCPLWSIEVFWIRLVACKVTYIRIKT